MVSINGVVARAKLQIQKGRARWGWFDIVVRTFKRFSEDDGGSYAAALTYYTFFSIFPLLLFSVAALGYVTFGNQDLQQDLIGSGLKAVPILRDALDPDVIEIIQRSRNNLALTGLILALYSGSGVVVALQHALNKIQHEPDEPNFLQKRLRSLMWLGILGAGAVTSLGLATLAGFAPGPLAFLFALVGGLLLNTALFATAFKFLPKNSRSWLEVLPGSIVAAVSFEILKVAGTAYLSRGAGMRSATFGAFAAAAGLLIASYLIAQVILLSAEVNEVLAERRATRQPLTTAA